MRKNFAIIDYFNYTFIAASAAEVAIHEYVADKTPEEASEMLYNKTWDILSKMLGGLKRRFEECLIVACSDTAGGTQFRKELNPAYKATRPSTRKLSFAQLDRLEELYNSYGIQVLHIPECEGDDAIYALCRVIKTDIPDAHIIIVSRDHDLLQVVQAGYADNQWDTSKKQFISLPPFSVVEMKCIPGDASDNIKGFPRVGEKTAIKYLTGLKEMTNEQKAIYEANMMVVDASKHPRLNENIVAATVFYKEKMHG